MSITTIKTYFHKDTNLNINSMLSKGSLYHSLLWKKVLEKGFNSKVQYIVTVKNDQLQAITPVCVKKKFGFSLFGSPLRGTFTEYMGPIFHDAMDEDMKIEIIIHQLSFLKKQLGIYIELGSLAEDLISIKLTKSLRSIGFDHSFRPSLEISLIEDEDIIWKSFESRARNMARKSEKHQVETKVEILTEKTLKEYYSFIEETFTRQKSKVPHSLNSYLSLVENLQTERKLLFVSGRINGKLVSGATFLIDNNRMVYHSASSNMEGFASAASSMIQWVAIKEAKSRGILKYDMGGIGIDSIDKFKRSFGRVEVHHNRWVYIFWPFKLLKGLVEWAQKKGFLRI